MLPEGEAKQAIVLFLELDSFHFDPSLGTHCLIRVKSDALAKASIIWLLRPDFTLNLAAKLI